MPIIDVDKIERIEKEAPKIGTYINIGGLKFTCVRVPSSVPSYRTCHLCAFEGLEKCFAVECTCVERKDKQNVIFVLKLAKQ